MTDTSKGAQAKQLGAAAAHRAQDGLKKLSTGVWAVVGLGMAATRVTVDFLRRSKKSVRLPWKRTGK